MDMQEEILESCYGQRREWMLYRISNHHNQITIQRTFTITTTQLKYLENVLKLLIHKHEILRTTLSVMHGELKQIIHPSQDFKINISYESITDDDENFDRYIKLKIIEERTQPFNFEFGPMFRVKAFTRSDGSAFILLTFHHLIFDFRSYQIFIEDALFFLQNPKLAISDIDPRAFKQFRDYSNFDSQLLKDQQGYNYISHWKRKLENGIPSLLLADKQKLLIKTHLLSSNAKEVNSRLNRLPLTDQRFVPTVIRRFEATNAGVIKYEINRSVFQKFKKALSTFPHSVSAILIGALLLTLNELSGQRAFAIELPVAERPNHLLNDVMGWLATGGLCFLTLSDTHDLGGLLSEIDDELFSLTQYSRFPYEVVGSEYAEKYGSHIPLFFNLSRHNNYVNRAEPEYLVSKRYGEYTCQDLALFVNLYEDALYMEVVYDNNLFDESSVNSLTLGVERTIDRISEHNYDKIKLEQFQ